MVRTDTKPVKKLGRKIQEFSKSVYCLICSATIIDTADGIDSLNSSCKILYVSDDLENLANSGQINCDNENDSYNSSNGFDLDNSSSKSD